MLDEAVNVSFSRKLDFDVAFIDTLADFKRGQQAGHPQCARRTCTFVPGRRTDLSAELVPAYQAERNFDLDRQIRVEDLVAELHPRHLLVG